MQRFAHRFLKLLLWDCVRRGNIQQRARRVRHTKALTLFEFVPIDRRQMQHHGARRFLAEGPWHRQMDFLRKQLAEPVNTQRRLVGSHCLRFVIAAAAPERQSNQIIVFGDRDLGQPIDAATDTLEVSFLHVVVRVLFRVASLLGLLGREIAALLGGQLVERSSCRLGVSIAHVQRSKIFGPVCIRLNWPSSPKNAESPAKQDDGQTGSCAVAGSKSWSLSWSTEALGTLAEQVEIEDTQLLRRLVARRCIYGVDINPVAVDLTRLSIWVHTFVPGLPLSLLDHNLIVGNSLVGIGQVSEIEDKARGDNLPLFTIDAVKLVGEAVEPLRRMAHIADATAVEVSKARKAMYEAREKTKPAEALCDIVAACRMTNSPLALDLEQWDNCVAFPSTRALGSMPTAETSCPIFYTTGRLETSRAGNI